jgi:hypothetical protein
MATKGWKICGVNRHNGKGPCGGPAMKGATTCRNHGGAANKAARARKVAIEKLQRAAAAYGYPVEVDPGDALQQEIDRTNGLVIFIGERLRNAGAADLVESIGTETKTGDLETYQIKRVEPVIGPWVQLYLKERQHLLALTRTALNIGLEQRRLDMEARVGLVLEAMALHIVTALGFDSANDTARKAISGAFVVAGEEWERAKVVTGEIVPLKRKRKSA